MVAYAVPAPLSFMIMQVLLRWSPTVCVLWCKQECCPWQLLCFVCVWYSRAVKCLFSPVFCLCLCVFLIGGWEGGWKCVLSDLIVVDWPWLVSLVSCWRPANTPMRAHTHTSLSFAVSPVRVCLCGVAVLSFFMSFSLSSPTFLHLSLNRIYCIFCFVASPLSLFLPPSHTLPPFFLPPVLPALFPVLFKSDFLLYSMKGSTVFLYLQQTDCIAASPVYWSL